MPRIASDVYVHLAESAAGCMETPVVLDDRASVGLVLASEGYPPAPTRTGEPITGLEAAAAVSGALVLHSGTDTNETGATVTKGGRVLTVVGTGADVRAARDNAYAAAAKISWPGVHYRHDIAAQALT